MAQQTQLDATILKEMRVYNSENEAIVVIEMKGDRSSAFFAVDRSQLEPIADHLRKWIDPSTSPKNQ